jgi:hypothetical protein
MAETSFIIQNGKRLDLKDSTARKEHHGALKGACLGQMLLWPESLQEKRSVLK